MASSTKIPIENIKANRETLLIVNPQAQEANNVAAKVSTTADPTIIASLRPNAKKIRATTDNVAKMSFWMSLLAFSLAVSP